MMDADDTRKWNAMVVENSHQASEIKRLQEQLASANGRLNGLEQERDEVSAEYAERHAENNELFKRAVEAETKLADVQNQLVKAEEWNRLRAEDIVNLGAQVGRLEIKIGKAREALIESKKYFDLLSHDNMVAEDGRDVVVEALAALTDEIGK